MGSVVVVIFAVDVVAKIGIVNLYLGLRIRWIEQIANERDIISVVSGACGLS